MKQKEQTAIHELALALRLTQEYVGDGLLPRLPGWTWFDALTKHAPEMLEQTDMPALLTDDLGVTEDTDETS